MTVLPKKNLFHADLKSWPSKKMVAMHAYYALLDAHIIHHASLLKVLQKV